MTSVLSLVSSRPSRTLAPAEMLIVQGEGGGDLFVLERGTLTVERDGIEIATLDQPGTVVGEMSVLIGTRNSATVRAGAGETRVKAIRDARQYLETDPALTLRLATLVAGRLDATSAMLVEMNKHATEKAEQGVLNRVLSALHIPRQG